GADRIRYIHEYDRDATAGPLQCRSDGCAGGQYDIGLVSDNLCCVLAKQLVVGGTRSILDECVATVSPAQFLKCLTKCDDLHPSLRVELVIVVQKADPSHPLRLLRARRERPHRRTADQRDELAPLHSITSSAVASSDGGTVRPSILAVSWLMTSSNFDDCTTGSSAGLVPWRMRPA